MKKTTDGLQTIYTEEDIPQEEKKEEGNKFSGVDKLFDEMGYEEACRLQDNIYKNYATAMRLRNREPLEEGRFLNHFFEGGNSEESLSFGSQKDGYLFGCEVGGVFIPTHFAPTTLRGGYKLIKDLVSSDVTTVFFHYSRFSRNNRKDRWLEGVAV